MQKVPTWKWIAILIVLLIGLYYLYPSFVWYSLPPDLRNSPNPITEKIAKIDAEIAQIRSATDTASLNRLRDLESERQAERERLYRLRSAAIPLGLDLAGGMHVVLEIVGDNVTDSPDDGRGQSLLDQALTVYRARIDKLGLTEPVVEKQPPNRILIQIPGVKNPDDVLSILRATARLEFRLAASRDLMTRTVDTILQANPTIRDKVVFQYPALRVAEENIESVSRALSFSKLDVPPDYSFIWGPVEVNPQTQEKTRNLYLIEDQIQMAGDTLTKAFVTYMTQLVTQPIVSLEFNREGTAQFARVTSEHVNECLAIVLDGFVYSAPSIDEPIRNGRAIIRGSFTTAEASNLAVVLEAGALKTDVRIIENRSIGPSLGMDSIKKGVNAAMYGLIATLIFMVAYYALSGVFADISLVVNLFLLMSAMAMFHASLTLPGIAGVILTIGMAVDANVLVFERTREEIAGRAGGMAISAIQRGYSRALSAILDGNITTILTALILMQYGTGPIKGFAITLTVGLVISMFTALFMTRVFQEWRAIGKKNESLSIGKFRFMEGTNVDFLKYAPICVVVSGIFIVSGLIYTITHWSNIKGLELTGGTMVRVHFDKPVGIESIRNQLTNDMKLVSAQIQEVGGESKEFIVRVKKGTSIPADQQVVQVLKDDGSIVERLGKGVIYTRDDEPEVDLGNFVTAGLAQLNTDNPVVPVGVESFSASFGEEMARKGLIIVILSWAMILLYVSFRFQVAYAVSAVVALIHDVLVCFGSLGFSHALGIHREINLSVIAAFLTIIGYSVNDTIVIFDRIRENRAGGKESLRDIINKSVNQTLSRSIITSLTVLIVVMILFFLGGDVINDFSFVMLVGVIAGSYSTIYIAGYILYLWQGQKQTIRERS